MQLFKAVLTEEAIQEVVGVLRSGWTGLGPKTKQFEKDFAQYLGIPHAVATNSCTAALHIALKLIDIQPGDEVICTALTFVSSNMVSLYEKAVPVFADVDETLCIDPIDIERKITSKTKAIIAVHYAGHPCDMDKINALAHAHNIWVIEDCAHASGSEYHGKKVGTLGDVGCFSFHAVKNLSISDYGMVVTHNELWAQRAQCLRWFGIDKSTYTRGVNGKYHWDYNVNELGYKYNPNDIMSALGLVQLRYLDRDNAYRQMLVNIYRRALGNNPFIQLPVVHSNVKTSNHLFYVQTGQRDELIEALSRNDICSGVHYRPNYHYDLFRPYLRGELPRSEQIWQRLISLPLHLGLQVDDVLRVCQVINEFTQQSNALRNIPEISETVAVAVGLV